MKQNAEKETTRAELRYSSKATIIEYPRSPVHWATTTVRTTQAVATHPLTLSYSLRLLRKDPSVPMDEGKLRIRQTEPECRAHRYGSSAT